MSFKDHFSGHAELYARFRPTYPAALYDWLVAYAAESTGIAAEGMTVWDVATGSGQAAVELAERTGRVLATDASSRQLSHATTHPRVRYACAPAEAPPLPEDSVALITVAQAIHWFDVPAFVRAARRVARPGAVLAAWTYELFTVYAPVDDIVADLYHGPVGEHWPPERRHIEARYETIPFPENANAPPSFEMRAEWTVEQVIGYLRTWSSVRGFARVTGQDPVEPIESSLREAWGDAHTRMVDWPFVLKVARLD